MVGRQPARTRYLRRGYYAAAWVAYLLLCGSIVLAGSMLKVTGFDLSPEQLQAAQPQKLEIPVTRIQSIPDSNNLCRVLLFHNNSGRYQDGGTGPCRNLISKEAVIWPSRRRAEAFAQAFKSAWKKDFSKSSFVSAASP